MPLLAKARINSAPRRLRAGFVGALAAALITSTSADAAGLIRDAETEALIREYAKPIFRAAGLGSQGIRIHLVNDRAFNAFVVDGHNMFMHAGTLMEAKTPNQVIGVIAHESGHITGGHLARLRTQVARAKSAALMLQLIGLAAMVGGAFAGAGDAGQAGMGIAYGGQDAALRTLLAYRQDEESSADQAGISFLNATKQSGRGMLETLEFMASKLVGVQGINPYLQTHPLPQQRLTQSQDPGHGEPVLQQYRSARAAIPARPDEGEAVRLPRRPANRAQSLSGHRPEPARDVCPSDRHLPPVRREGGHAAA